MHALIVESPSKSKTISKYLGKDFKILSSFGHVRALPTKKGSVETEKDFKMIYELTEQGKKIVPDIIKQLKNVKTKIDAQKINITFYKIIKRFVHALWYTKSLKTKTMRSKEDAPKKSYTAFASSYLFPFLPKLWISILQIKALTESSLSMIYE